MYIPAINSTLLNNEPAKATVVAAPKPVPAPTPTPTATTSNPGVLVGPTSASKEGADVAKAAGVAYADIGKPTGDPSVQPGYNAAAASQGLETYAPLKSGLSYVDQDKSTAMGQLNTLLSSDSEYIKQAEESGRKWAQSRGLLNSSAAAGSARRAAVEAAAPIAMADATAYATAQGKQQSGEIAQTQTETEGIVSSEMNKHNAAIAQKTKDIQNMFEARMQGASDSNKVFLQDFQNKYNTFNTEMQFEQNKFLQAENISAERAATVTTAANSVMQNYQIAVENMMTDPDFLDLGPAVQNKAIANMQTLARNNIKFIGASSGIKLDAFVNAYLAPIAIR